MKNTAKHIDKLNFVKVYLQDKKGEELIHFEGIIFSETKEFLFMSDLSDFNFDGFVIVRKSDVSEVRRSDNEKFFNRILKGEKIIHGIQNRHSQLKFKLDEWAKMFARLQKKNLPLIIENLYKEQKDFQIGPIHKVEKNHLLLNYITPKGIIEKEPVKIKYKKITFVRIDSPYANNFYKYSDKTTEKELPKKKKKKTKNSGNGESPKVKKTAKKNNKASIRKKPVKRMTMVI